MEKHGQISLSFFMPAYNEQESIELALKSAIQVLKKISTDFELIVVDDGSNDDTIQKVNRFIRQERRVRIISHGINRGYGKALRTGIDAARKEYTFYTDADNQFDVQKLPEITKTLTPNQMIIGYRTRRQDSWQRLFMSWAYGKLIKYLFKIEVADINCSFKLFPTSLYRKFPLYSSTVFIDAEMVILAKRAGLHLKEVPVTHFQRIRGKSKFELGKKGVMMVIHPLKVIEIVKEIISLYPSLRGFSSTAKIDNPNGKGTMLRT